MKQTYNRLCNRKKTAAGGIQGAVLGDSKIATK